MIKPGPFSIFIGIDQTGAAMAGGARAKALPCAVLYLKDAKWSLEVLNSGGKPIMISSFNRAEIAPLAEERNYALGDLALAVDCVMGLPVQAWPSCQSGSAPLWNLFAQAARDEDGRIGYGLKPAAAFFDRIREAASINDKPVRRCEILAKANSVFNTHPFQKNVQCGTYRIWRDLGLEALPPHKRWLRFWNFDDIRQGANEAWFFESYPSLFWRDVLGLKSRKISELRKRIEQLFAAEIEIPPQTWGLLEGDPDHADSAVLALGAWLLQSKQDIFMRKDLPRETWLKKEGWILGLKLSTPVDVDNSVEKRFSKKSK